MSNDRELLELAAKAAGYTLRWYEWTELYGSTYGIEIEPGNPLGFDPWNPLTDDGDALRLAVKLRISPILRLIGCDATDSGKGMAYEKYCHDDLAATRRAIVRAAAEIGRAMP